MGFKKILSSATAKAPSNIALIKYMGKDDYSLNIPANPSLSLTLNSLCSYAEVKLIEAPEGSITWLPALPQSVLQEDKGRIKTMSLSESGKCRVTAHIERVIAEASSVFLPYGLSFVSSDHLSIEVKTANTFPTASGIASSASSFAAITLATVAALAAEKKKLNQVLKENTHFIAELASLSRKGSGSSCRSFHGPWVLWQDKEVSSLRSSLPEMSDLVIVVTAEAKKISSSDAHRRVLSSPLWQGRQIRVSKRVAQLQEALVANNLKSISKIAFDELWEMHSLFHTSSEPFTYWQPGSVKVLKWFIDFLQQFDEPLIVTMDAGPNVHVLVRTSQANSLREKLSVSFPDFQILQDSQGSGATIID